MESHGAGKNEPCPCRSGKKYRQCCWLTRFQKAAPAPPSVTARTPPANGSSRGSVLEPDLFVKAFQPDRREWADARLADVQVGQEFIAHNCLHQIVRPNVYASYPLVDMAKIPEADRPYDPLDFRTPKGRDVVDALRADGSPIGHRLLANLDPGQHCVFQGLVYHIQPGPTSGTAKIVGYGEVDHRPDDRLYVWLGYVIEDALGTAEVSYRYPHGRLIPLADGGAVPVEDLTPGVAFVLEDGGPAVVTRVGRPERWDPGRELLDAHGNGFQRVVGTFRFTGWIELMTVAVGGEVHRVTPGHRYWSETRRGWYPIGTFQVGELLLSEESRPTPIEALTPPRMEYETVYNFEVDEYHTYFLGRGTTSVWSHNGLGGAGCGVPKAAEVEAPTKGRVGLHDKSYHDGYDAIFGKERPANYHNGVVEGPVPGPNPNNLTARRVDPVEGPTTGGEGVYIKPHDGKTKVGSTNDFRYRYDLDPPEGGGTIAFEISQTRTGPPSGLSAAETARWTARRQRRFDEAYVDTLFKRDQLFRADNEKAPVDPRKWRAQRRTFGYGSLPDNFVDGM
jgi:hypothetical protein